MKSSTASATTSASATASEELWHKSPVPWTPHLGQKRGVKFLLENACGILAAEPGVGKSSMVLGAFKILKKKGVASKMLVVAPLKPCYLVWPREQAKWVDFKEMKIQVLHEKTRREDLIEDADICVINPDGLDWLLGAKRVKDSRGRTSVTTDLKRFKSFGFDTLVIDELTRFKHHGSGRFKVLKTVLHTFGRRWGLTGSLVANGLMDLFGQCYVIDLGRTFGAYITHFRMTYFYPDHDGFGWSLQEGAEERIYDRLRPLTLRLAAEDYVDMPQVVENVIEFDLPPKVQQLYDKLEARLIAQIEDRTVVAANAAAASTKCRQIANGGIYLDPEVIDLLDKSAAKTGREWLNLHTEKVDLLEDLIEELQGSPLLVAYDFEHDIDRLRTKFGKDIPYIGGGVPAKRFEELERLWNQGKLPVLFVHPKSVAHGLNLQESGFHVAWHSMTWDYEEYDQLIRRIRRQGSKARRVFVHHLIARNTIDETMLWSVRNKAKGQSALYDALARKVRR